VLRSGQPCIHRVPGKSRGHDANHGTRLAVKKNRPSGNGRVAVEVAHPRAISQHDNEWRAVPTSAAVKVRPMGGGRSIKSKKFGDAAQRLYTVRPRVHDRVSPSVPITSSNTMLCCAKSSNSDGENTVRARPDCARTRSPADEDRGTGAVQHSVREDAVDHRRGSDSDRERQHRD
jgi:hypothetical protein